MKWRGDMVSGILLGPTPLHTAGTPPKGYLLCLPHTVDPRASFGSRCRPRLRLVLELQQCRPQEIRLRIFSVRPTAKACHRLLVRDLHNLWSIPPISLTVRRRSAYLRI